MNIQQKEIEVLTYHGNAMTQDRLKELFEMVENKDNWKMPIDAIVPADTDLKDLDAAIVHFTGSLASFQRLEDGQWHVRAAGYYNTIGA